mgnify:CR=1 FL=1
MSNYFTKRKHAIYLAYVDYMVCAVGSNAQSLIDIGSRNCGYFRWWPWIEDKVSLDLSEPYRGSGVRSIKADFFEWEPDRRYDVATCLQVLEHIQDARRFAHKLMTLADHVIVSVPYRWKEGTVRTHVQDPVDEAKFNSWFPHPPNYSIIATEPFSRRNGQRIVAYFDTQNPGSTAYRRTRALASKRMLDRAAPRI